MAGQGDKAGSQRTKKSVDSKGGAHSTGVVRHARKAPTRTAARAKRERTSIKTAVAVALAAVVVSGTAVAIGMTDDGPINVASTISNRASEQDASGDTEGSAATRSVRSPSAGDPNTPNGGLVGRGNRETEQQRLAAQNAAAETRAATTTASTSDEAAEEEADDGDDAETVDETSAEEAGGETEDDDEPALGDSE